MNGKKALFANDDEIVMYSMFHAIGLKWSW
jgi:hypothetical protein